MITIVVGAQYGGEGKGKVSAFLASAQRFDIACRCGGPNSSHTAVHKGREFKLRMMPTAAIVDPWVSVVFAAGTLLHVPTLFDEIRLIGFRGNLLISPYAGIITDETVAKQRSDNRYEAIGSTLTGTGYAAADRCLRKLPLAREFSELSPYLFDVHEFLFASIKNSRNILIEGHQGFGLSNYHGDYPYVSSRDSTAAAMLSELGVGPLQKTIQVVLVAKIFPTRNHRGALGEELTEEEASAMGIREYGGGSWGIPNRRRRVGIFDFELVRRAAAANSATCIALTGADYLDKALAGQQIATQNEHLDQFVCALEKTISPTPVRFVSTGRDTSHMFELKPASSKKPKRPRRVKRPENVRDLFEGGLH